MICILKESEKEKCYRVVSLPLELQKDYPQYYTEKKKVLIFPASSRVTLFDPPLCSYHPLHSSQVMCFCKKMESFGGFMFSF